MKDHRPPLKADAVALHRSRPEATIRQVVLSELGPRAGVAGAALLASEVDFQRHL
ncbi:hypothetical protein PV341_18035 [Streptomyces sp. PA03-1a]|nr:hypothetical protein [Streptomyces sp. PA03-1a]MDX2818280.1 hypothetical protein [Streptomyces sp. PA03-5A]